MDFLNLVEVVEMLILWFVIPLACVFGLVRLFGGREKVVPAGKFDPAVEPPWHRSDATYPKPTEWKAMVDAEAARFVPDESIAFGPTAAPDGFDPQIHSHWYNTKRGVVLVKKTVLVRGTPDSSMTGDPELDCFRPEPQLSENFVNAQIVQVTQEMQRRHDDDVRGTCFEGATPTNPPKVKA